MIGGRLGSVSIAQAQIAVCAPEASRHVRSAVARDMRDVECAIGDGLVNDYHRRRHDDTGRAPLDAWREADQAAHFRAPTDCLRFRLSFLPEAICALTSGGIGLRGETFWSLALAQMLRDGRMRVAVKIRSTRSFAHFRAERRRAIREGEECRRVERRRVRRMRRYDDRRVDGGRAGLSPHMPVVLSLHVNALKRLRASIRRTRLAAIALTPPRANARRAPARADGKSRTSRRADRA